MLQLVVIAFGLVMLVLLPIQTGKLRSGAVSKNFRGTPEEYRDANLKQITWFMWIGIGVGIANVVLLLLNLESGGWVFFLIGAAIWFAVAAVALWSRGQLSQQAA